MGIGGQLTKLRLDQIDRVCSNTLFFARVQAETPLMKCTPTTVFRTRVYIVTSLHVAQMVLFERSTVIFIQIFGAP